MTTINNEEEYKQVLEEFYTELDRLSKMLDEYEDKHYPVPPPSTWEAIKFVMSQRFSWLHKLFFPKDLT